MFLLCSLALAVEHRSASLGEVFGFTADGALAYGVDVHDLYEPAGEIMDASDYEPGTVHHVVVLRGDAIAHDWVVGADLPNHVARPKDDAAAWATWRQANPLTAPVKGASNAAGVRVDLVGVETGAGGPPWQLHRGMDDDEQPVTVALSNAGKGRWVVGSVVPAWPVWSSSATSTVDAYWTAGGDRVAVVFVAPEQMTMRGPSFGRVEVHLRQATPLVSVLAPKALGEPTASKVAAAIADLGAIDTGEAKAERDATVVFYAPGHEDAAKAIAAKVPGGATVEPITWDAHQHVVVAVGASAR